MSKILVLNGPNLNLLGHREPEIYGSTTLSEIEHNLTKIAAQRGIILEFFQSNHEGELISKTGSMLNNDYGFAIINPAGYTHTSVAWRDAILAVKVPFLEVHLSNIFAREKFRHFSYFSDIAVGIISGLGVKGYEMALTYAMEHLLKKD